MRQPSSIEPFTPSPTIVLHPALQATLDNLDVQIDEELTRYRRQRRYPTATTPRRKPLATATSGATAMGILKNNIQLPTPRSSIYDSQAANSRAANSRAANGRAANSQAANSQAINNQAINNQAAPPTASQTAPPLYRPVQRPAHQVQTQAGIASSVAVSERPAAVPTVERVVSPSPVPVTFAAEARLPEPERATDEIASARIASYAEQNDLSAYAPSSTLQKFVQQSVAYSSPNAPDDYLASSEELLRSIAEEDRDLQAERDPNTLLDTLLTPMGVGSMLLLVLASTTLGYAIMNPASLGLWPADSTPDTSGNDSSASPAATANDKAAPSPDLASDEFVDLDLDTLSTIPKQSSRAGAQTANSTEKSKSNSAKSNSAKPTTTRSSAGTTSATQAATSSTAPVELPVAPDPQPSLSTVVVPAAPPVMSIPEPAEPAPAPAPVSLEPISTAPPPIEPAPIEPAPIEPVASSSPTPVEPAPEPAPSVATAPAAPSNPYYYVVTEYSGDASLQQARGAVPDAYVRNLPAEGAKVQLGAFSDETKAQELLQQLQQQGIEAEVYTP